jgi:hypothetical protein
MIDLIAVTSIEEELRCGGKEASTIFRMMPIQRELHTDLNEIISNLNKTLILVARWRFMNKAIFISICNTYKHSNGGLTNPVKSLREGGSATPINSTTFGPGVCSINSILSYYC